MPFHIQLKSPLPARMDATRCTRSAWCNESLTNVLASSIFLGNQKERFGDFFSVKGNPNEDVHIWEGDLSLVDGIGAQLAEGSIVIQGSAGKYVGMGMRGGRIDVFGNVSDFCGNSMAGGFLQIHGNAGDRLGGIRDENSERMVGGEIVVCGSTGDDTGYRMRRGMIVVESNCGHRCGYQLRAGTLIVGGQCGSSPGLGMRRGSLILGPSAEIPSAPYLVRGSRCHLFILGLIRERLRYLGFHEHVNSAHTTGPASPLALLTQSENAAIYHGDLLEGGRGEILQLAPK
jgi:formylmethanofuran dehydrogenase subunit C